MRKDKIMEHIKSLRQVKKEYGSIIRFHTFNLKKSTTDNKQFNFGKITCCIIRLTNIDERFVGFSFCSPKDNYWKEYGQFIAFNRCTMARPYVKIKKEQLRETILMEATRKHVPWMIGIKEEDLV